ncbi:MAG: glutamine synthetase [Chloroflexi bacterium]|nr:glutamine synthetase [Chloroflexota bacterium]
MSSEAMDIVARAESEQVFFVSLQFTDLFGTVKNVTIPVGRLETVLKRGCNFDGSSIEGFARIAESDMVLHPDPHTYTVLPWTSGQEKTARLICDAYDISGQPFVGDPRHILKRALDQAQQMGFRYDTGPEVEFYLFKMDGEPKISPVPQDVGGYFDFSPRDLASRVRNDIALVLQAMGIEVEATHHECGPGQHEVDFHYADALASADAVVTLRYAIKAVAQHHGLYATFMPKPLLGVAGSGMHTHQSLSSADGRNAFYDASDPYKLSRLAYAFIAGQMAHARAMAAIVAPTVNSYKRLVPGYEAPVYICWGQVNRSALIRIPANVPGLSESSARCELRCPDPSANPYLSFAVMLATGLDGIRRNLVPPPPVEENVYEFDSLQLRSHDIASLPGTLEEALQELERDEVIAQALGEHTFRRYLDAKRLEWDEYRIQVTNWELNRYLTTL